MDSLNSGQWQVLQQVASGAPLSQVLAAIVRLVESRAGSSMLCTILLFDAQHRTLTYGAASQLPEDYVRAIEGYPVGPYAGSCGAAAYHGTAIFIDDIATHPNWADASRRDLVLAHGFVACWSSPIFSAEHELLGTFAMYYRERRGPTSDEMAWVATATHLAAIAIVRDRSERSLRKSEERLRLLNELGETMRAESDPDRVLPVALRILGRHLHVSRCAYCVVEADERCTVPYDYTDGCASIVGEYFISQFGDRVASGFRQGTGPVVVRDVDAELAATEGVEVFKALEIRSFICCCLVRDGALRAMMAVHHKEPRDFTSDEVAIVQEFVERCWAAIEQRAAESRLRQNEALLRIAGQAAKLGGWTLELPELRLTWSDEMCAIHEVSPGAVPTLEGAIAFYTPQYREHIRSCVAACALEGKPFDIEADLLTAKGRCIRVRAVGRAERAQDGVITRVLGAFQDVDDRKKLEEQLRHAQKMEAIGRLAGSIAHDFNNLLSVILSYSELVLLELSPASPLHNDVEAIKRAGERASDLTRQLLAFSRRQVLAPKVLDLNTLVRESERILQRLLGEDIELVTRLTSEPATVKVDPGQIDQVVMNLAVNARDAMPTGGKLMIETREVFLDEFYAREHVGITPGPHVMLSISDTGVGMDQSTQARIFEPFFTTKEQGKGTGLGLSTVFGIVKQSGGSIWVYSEPNAGTAFKIFFPKAEEPTSARAAAVKPESLEGTETILLVEDQDEVRQVAREILRRYGYDVIETRSAADALRVCERHPRVIHLVLTDVVMPKMNGRELAERLLLLRPKLRILYMSGYTDDAIVHHGVLDSGVAYLQKPLVPVTLARHVREVLDAPFKETRPPETD